MLLTRFCYTVITLDQATKHALGVFGKHTISADIQKGDTRPDGIGFSSQLYVPRKNVGTKLPGSTRAALSIHAPNDPIEILVKVLYGFRVLGVINGGHKP